MAKSIFELNTHVIKGDLPMQIKCNDFIFKSQKRFALSFYNFYAPEIEDRGEYCFFPVCNSVLSEKC